MSAVTGSPSAAHLEVRAAVEARVLDHPGGDLVYLSLLGEEIEDRLLRFVDRAAQLSRTPTRPTAADLTAAADRLELTDAVVIRSPAETTVLRGAACSVPLFWRRDRTGLRIATRLPVSAGDPLSQAGLLASFASSCHGGAYEPNGSLASPLAGWSRVRRGSVTRFGAADRVDELRIAVAVASPADEDAVAAAVRAAFVAYGQSQRRVGPAMVELSGGYDSTLAATFAQSGQSGPSGLSGVSVHFPYYEFRLEESVQQATARALGVSREVIDGTTVFPYAPAESWPRFDEPTAFVTGIRHAELVGECARAAGARRLYVGHGGDQSFSTDLTANEPVGRPLRRAAVARRAWPAAAAAVELASSARSRSTGCFVYDGRQDVWAKERFGFTVRSPFADLAVFRAAVQWSQWCARQGLRPDKSILRRALADHLPPAVINRHGKVSYDGVWARAHQRHAGHIATSIEASSPVFERIGLDTSWLLGQAARLAERRPGAEAEVLAAYAVAAWLLSWELTDADVRPATPVGHARSKKKFWNSRPSVRVRPK